MAARAPRWLVPLALALAVPLAAAGDALDVALDTSEADAALAVLEARAAGREPAAAAWERLWSSEGYTRLKAREASMKRPFTDEAFREFLLDPATVARTGALRDALATWRGVDLAAAAGRARAYLPAGAGIRARVYVTIKPRPNSFVFDGDGGVPAIVLYLDPAVSAAKLANTLAHEMHHIGIDACMNDLEARYPEGPPARRTALTDLLRFSEGLAMLAAAGGPDAHPHAASDPADRARWDRDVAHAGDDLQRVAALLRRTLDGSLSGDAHARAAFEFYGEQGAWYTLGYVMSAAIERAFGRARVVECFCDVRQLLPTYEAAAAKLADPALPRWPADLVEALGPVAPGPPQGWATSPQRGFARPL